MRPSSRRPWLSNRQSSTFCALAENSAKLVPRPSQLAPMREDVPADNRIFSFLSFPVLEIWRPEAPDADVDLGPRRDHGRGRTRFVQCRTPKSREHAV